jgi:hypothetical protein
MVHILWNCAIVTEICAKYVCVIICFLVGVVQRIFENCKFLTTVTILNELNSLSNWVGDYLREVSKLILNKLHNTIFVIEETGTSLFVAKEHLYIIKEKILCGTFFSLCFVQNLLDLRGCTRVWVGTIRISKENSTTKAREVSYVANYIPLTNPRHLAASRTVCLASHSKLVATNLPDLPHPLKAKLHRPIYADKLILSNGGYGSFDSFSRFWQRS